MKLPGNFKYVLLLSAIILIMMIIKVYNNNTWPENAAKAAETAVLRHNFVTMENLGKMGEHVSLIKTGLPVPGNLLPSFPGIEVTWEEMMEKQFLKKLNQPDRTYVIVSGSPADGVKAWVMLNQMGVGNLFILDLNGMNSERFKYQFQPDTTISLELESAEN